MNDPHYPPLIEKFAGRLEQRGFGVVERKQHISPVKKGETFLLAGLVFNDKMGENFILM